MGLIQSAEWLKTHSAADLGTAPVMGWTVWNRRGMSWTSTAAAVRSEGQSDTLLTPLKSHFIVQTVLSILILLLELSSPPWLYSTSSSVFSFICEYCFLISLHCHHLLIQYLSPRCQGCWAAASVQLEGGPPDVTHASVPPICTV